MNQPLIHIEDFTMAYREKPVLWDIDLDIPQGVRCAIVGPNGAGKSTLLKGVLGLVSPISGYVTIWDKPLKEVRKKIAYVPQTGSVNWDFPTNVLDVVTMGRYAHLPLFQRPKKQDRERALRAIEEMQLQEVIDRPIAALSGGQKQRVFIARAICQDANLYIMDEPLTGVDEKTEHIIMQKFREFQENGKTVIAVHHDLNTLQEYFDYLVLLNRTVAASGPLKETFTDENIALAYR